MIVPAFFWFAAAPRAICHYITIPWKMHADQGSSGFSARQREAVVAATDHQAMDVF